MRFKKIFALISIVSIVTVSSFSSLAMAEFSSMLAPTPYTPGNYIAPKYDTFDHDYYRPPTLSDREVDTVPTADFTLFSQQQGFTSLDVGTTETEFIFDASGSTDRESDSGKLEVRWDFESDGKVDSYFSRTKAIRHTFKNPGTYHIKLEVLDKGGNISSTTKSLTIVESTPPDPYFSFTPKTGTQDTIFQFDTRYSRDDQHKQQYLTYRFDWNGDAKWDTAFENKTLWKHRFGSSGVQRVIMEIRDPSGQTAVYTQNITTTVNTPPVAAFTIRTFSNGFGKKYIFDAKMSADKETIHSKLQFRWDFNYHGPNDIVTDTIWSYGDTYNGSYHFPGHKVIRLEVKDQSGAVAYSYATIDVEPGETTI